MSEPSLTFKQMCDRFFVTSRTLRYYEYIELIKPERLSGKRVYGRREIARMTLIRRARRFGFSLEEIRKWLELYVSVGPQEQLEEGLKKLDRRLMDLRNEQDEIARIMREIEDLRVDVAKSLKTRDSK